MTLARLTTNLEDAIRQALADGPRGTGQRGPWSVVRGDGIVWVYLWLRRERDDYRQCVCYALEHPEDTAAVRYAVDDLCGLARGWTDLDLPA